MKIILVILSLGMFTFSSSTTNQYDIVDATEQAQLFDQIEAQLDIVDEVVALDLQQDADGDYYYDVKGTKAGQAVSFTAAVSSAAGGCSCSKDGAVAPSPHFFWVCIVPCL